MIERKKEKSMTRPIWNGFITFGLVNIPVVLYSAEKKFDIQFKLIDSRDKSKIRYMRINEQTGEEVPWNHVAKGYEYDDHSYVMLKEADLKAIAGEHSKAIDIAHFVDRNSLRPELFERPYYLLPDNKGEKGYVMLREILKETKKIGICKVMIHTREYLAALIPEGDALLLNLLRYQQELRKPSDFEFPKQSLKAYKVSEREMEIAKQLVNSMTSKWNPAAYHDEFRDALQKWIEDKIKHPRKKAGKTKSESHLTKTNVINFVDLLKKSLDKKKHPITKSHSKKKAERKSRH
jgi:DNA end-binding protein Ku